jgi:hypothetical protein
MTAPGHAGGRAGEDGDDGAGGAGGDAGRLRRAVRAAEDGDARDGAGAGRRPREPSRGAGFESRRDPLFGLLVRRQLRTPPREAGSGAGIGVALRASGPPVYSRYNPPFTPWFLRQERDLDAAAVRSDVRASPNVGRRRGRMPLPCRTVACRAPATETRRVAASNGSDAKRGGAHLRAMLRGRSPVQTVPPERKSHWNKRLLHSVRGNRPRGPIRRTLAPFLRFAGRRCIDPRHHRMSPA